MMDKYISAYVPVVHGEFPMSSFFKRTFMRTVVSGYSLSNVFGEEKAARFVKEVIDNLPENAQELAEDHIGDDFMVDIEHYCDTVEVFRKEAEAYVDYLIPAIYDTSGDDSHYDYVPSAVEEFIILCRQFNCIEPLQRLYNSIFEGPPVHLQKQPDSATCPYVLEIQEKGEDVSRFMEWHERHAYHPSYDDEVCLRDYFLMFDGIIRHKDHPRDIVKELSK